MREAFTISWVLHISAAEPGMRLPKLRFDRGQQGACTPCALWPRLGRYTDPHHDAHTRNASLSSSHLLILDRGQDFFKNL